LTIASLRPNLRLAKIATANSDCGETAAKVELLWRGKVTAVGRLTLTASACGEQAERNAFRYLNSNDTERRIWWS